MATFSYAESEKYFNLVKLDIESGKKVKLGPAGEEEVLFDETKFRPIADKVGQNLLTALKKKNNTYFTSTVGGVYRFTQIFKGTYSGQVAKISTSQQEQITLKVIEEVLSNKSPHYKSFSEMFDDKKSGIYDIFPKLRSNNGWWNHFSLQFNEIEKTTDFPSSKYDVYSYTKFMDFITEIVTDAPRNWYSKKDSWNPADIWLIKNSKLKKYEKEIEESVNIKEVNRILKIAYREHDIVGISLKKSSGGLEYDEVNLELNPGQQKLPNVDVSGIKLDCTYKNGMFESKTSYIFVADNNRLAYKLAFKSNTGDKKLGNITYEFLAVGAAAFLGKVPKDRLTKMIEDFIDDEGKNGANTMPQHSRLPKKWTKSVESEWNRRVTVIKNEFKGGIDNIGNFVDNLEDSYVINGGITPNNATMMQMVEFTYILARLQQINKLQEFATKCFYFAQKKGQKYDFGPFGKLY